MSCLEHLNSYFIWLKQRHERYEQLCLKYGESTSHFVLKDRISVLMEDLAMLMDIAVEREETLCHLLKQVFKTLVFNGREIMALGIVLPSFILKKPNQNSVCGIAANIKITLDMLSAISKTYTPTLDNYVSIFSTIENNLKIILNQWLGKTVFDCWQIIAKLNCDLTQAEQIFRSKLT